MDSSIGTHATPPGSVRRSRDIGGTRLVTVRYAPGTERVRSNCPDGQFWLMLRGGWQTRVVGRRVADCEPFSLSYHVPGEKNRRQVGALGASLFGIQIKSGSLDAASPHPYLPEPVLQEKGPAGLLAMRIFRAFSEEDTADAVILEELLPELIFTTAGQTLPALRADEPLWIERAREFLHARHTEPLTLREIADACGIHPVYLTAAFRRRFGCTVGEYLRRLRIETALRRLCKTEDEIGWIAREAGFYDQAHFNRVFKAHVGIAPGALRRMTTNV